MNNIAPRQIFKSGDSVWLANCGVREVTGPCPVCFGKRSVVVILGNDEQVQTPCDYCGKGWDGPRGVEIVHEWIAEPMLVTVAGVRTDADGEKQSVDYRFYNNYIGREDDVFTTKEEAQVRCSEKANEHAEEERRRRECLKENATKSFSWHVGYHRRCIKQAERNLEWHRSRVIACAKLARTPILEEQS